MGHPPLQGPESENRVAPQKASFLQRYRLVIAASLIALVGVAGWFFLSFQRPKGRMIPEVEPNDEPRNATPISTVRAATGSLAHRDATGVPDRDMFRLRIPRGPARILRVEVIGGDGLDHQIEVTSEKGERLTWVNNVGPSETEVIPNLTVDGDATYYIVVSEAEGNAPRSDGEAQDYRLHLALRKASHNDETEPNDDPSRATRMRLASPMLAFSTSVADVDCFTVPGPGGGSLEGEVLGLKGVDWMIEVHEENGAGKPQVIDQGGIAEPEHFSVAWPMGRAPSFCVRRKPASTPTGDPSSLSAHYLLLVRRSP